jgi:hypothetical protein
MPSIEQDSVVLVPTEPQRDILSGHGITVEEGDSVMMTAVTKRSGEVTLAHLTINEDPENIWMLSPQRAVDIADAIPALTPNDGMHTVRMHAPVVEEPEPDTDATEEHPEAALLLHDAGDDADDEEATEVDAELEEITAAAEAAREAAVQQRAASALAMQAATEAEEMAKEAAAAAEAKKAAQAEKRAAALAAKKASVTTPRSSRKPAVEKATESAVTAIETELMDNLATHGLTGMAEGLRKAGVVSMTALWNHTVAELLESLQRRGIRGKDYVFSSVERRTLIRMGMEEGDPPPAGAPTAAPPVRPDAAPAAADADLAAWLHHKAGDPPPLRAVLPPPLRRGRRPACCRARRTRRRCSRAP